MIGNMSIDLSLANIWRSYYLFRRGKKPSSEISGFQYYLEENLFALFLDLNNGQYSHGGYKYFEVSDNKKRQISVASVRDRVIHRLIYEYLEKKYDKTFIFDLWSNRKGKGLAGAIKRTQSKIYKHKNSFIWRSDIKKFFDSVDHDILLDILSLKIKNQNELKIISLIIRSFSKNSNNGKGLPIGNLTSQILSNVYLNEFDRYVKHVIKPQFYLRYGDDFIAMEKDRGSLEEMREKIIQYLDKALGLKINHKNDIIIKASQGVKFLGVIIYPQGRKLNKRNIKRIKDKSDLSNISSYVGLARANHQKLIKEINWRILSLTHQDNEKFF